MSLPNPSVDRDVFTLARMARVLERACTDITLPQYRLLAFISRGEERASNLAERLALTRPTVSATIDTLVERALLERTAIDTDRRAVRLTITPEGRRSMDGAEAAMRSRLDDVLDAADDPDLVRAALEQLGAALSASAAAAKVAKAAQAVDGPATDAAASAAPA
ncbi:MAG: MarR family transcriptional regulator [Acidimicrobiia bacterium]